VEEVTTARGAPVWFQLYARKGEVTEALLRRAERAGSPVVVVTVDAGAPTNWETLLRLRRTDARQCDGCHGSRNFQDYVNRRPNFDGIDLSDPTSLNIANLTWDSIMRLRDTVKTKIVLKGILTHEDAKLAADNGLDGIIVSNHGGRVVDSGRATIEILPEIIEAVGGRMPVLVDSGFRRGTDIIKALVINRTPEVHFFAGDPDNHLVGMAAVVRPRAVPSQPSCDHRPEFPAPRAIRHRRARGTAPRPDRGSQVRS
jgi:4-hydroxymandelate oxidase